MESIGKYQTIEGGSSSNSIWLPTDSKSVYDINGLVTMQNSFEYCQLNKLINKNDDVGDVSNLINDILTDEGRITPISSNTLCIPDINTLMTLIQRVAVGPHVVGLNSNKLTSSNKGVAGSSSSDKLNEEVNPLSEIGNIEGGDSSLNTLCLVMTQLRLLLVKTTTLIDYCGAINEGQSQSGDSNSNSGSADNESNLNNSFIILMELLARFLPSLLSLAAADPLHCIFLAHERVGFGDSSFNTVLWNLLQAGDIHFLEKLFLQLWSRVRGVEGVLERTQEAKNTVAVIGNDSGTESLKTGGISGSSFSIMATSSGKSGGVVVPAPGGSGRRLSFTSSLTTPAASIGTPGPISNFGLINGIHITGPVFDWFHSGTKELGCPLVVLGGDVHISDGTKVRANLHFSSVAAVPALSTSLITMKGRWFYEVTLLSDGLMQIGWANPSFRCDPVNGIGVGDHVHR